MDDIRKVFRDIIFDHQFNNMQSMYLACKDLLDRVLVNSQDNDTLGEVSADQIVDAFSRVQDALDKRINLTTTKVCSHAKQLKDCIKGSLDMTSLAQLSKDESHTLLILLSYPEHLIIKTMIAEYDLFRVHQEKRENDLMQRCFVLFCVLYSLSEISQKIACNINEYANSAMFEGCIHVALASNKESPVLKTTLNKAQVYNICPGGTLRNISARILSKIRKKSSHFKM
ncbi:MAG: hypothetical protein P857_898 [Candidatus Xenolissoclinum pacificiensis L6]|uniref:Uncharacterized protein n=1 Tax=Candidatus Xenolissoclinum pacificiensis L6 TaxID=1401685 RepID=W2V003_9RICK|nr:MAG: hypothetical protein P857_898 [Candidatus Xenolissoclinum pacificiensis L6]